MLHRRLNTWLVAAAVASAGLAFGADAAKPVKAVETKAPAAVKPFTEAAPAVKAEPKAETVTKQVPVKDAKAGTSGTVVEIKTSEGVIKVELADKEAPVSVKNFLGYVNDKFYDGTVFHRVIDSFMIQGGGYTIDGDKISEKPTKAAITNEAKNGLKNDRGTLAMARTSDPNSATAQFFINLVNNDRLNAPNPDGHGYAVFGKVLEGLDVVDKIGHTKTAQRFGLSDVPVADVKLLSVTVVKAASH